MKKLTTTLFFVALTMSVLNTLSAQANKGAWMLGGSISFDSDKHKDDDGALTTLSIEPNVGYYIIDNLAIGLGVGYESIKYDGDNLATSSSIQPWARYYVYNGLFAQVGYEILSEKALEDDAVKGGRINIGVGYSWWLNNSLAIEPSIRYGIGSGDLREDVSTFGLRIGIQGFIGRD